MPWVGGKNRLCRTILQMIPSGHRVYVEPFAGGAQLLFRKPPSPVEVLNDLDNDLVTFYRVVQHHCDEFVRCLQLHLTSRAWFHLWQRTDPSTLTDIYRAVRLYYLQKTAWGGLVRKRSYHYHVVKQPNFNPTRVRETITKAHERLAHVQIESMPFEEVLRKYDRTDAFFFCDPPYYCGKKLYNHDFIREDFDKLAAVLSAIEGKFILTLNDVPDVHALFGAFNIFSTTIVYSAERNARRHRELVITNFEPTGPVRDIEKL